MQKPLTLKAQTYKKKYLSYMPALTYQLLIKNIIYKLLHLTL